MENLVAEEYAAFTVGLFVHQTRQRFVDTGLQGLQLFVELRGGLHGAVVDEVTAVGFGIVGVVDVLERILRTGRHEVAGCPSRR